MPLTPQDIIRKEFREAFRGYNQSDVDAFLDEVADEVGRLIEENQRARTRLAGLSQELARLRGAPASSAPATGTPVGASDDLAPREEGEIRARVRKFLQEQLRLLDANETSSRTVERIAREVPPPPVPARPGESSEEARSRFWGDQE